MFLAYICIIMTKHVDNNLELAYRRHRITVDSAVRICCITTLITFFHKSPCMLHHSDLTV
uniref:Ovule protein n=1 Tax=Ascaris lumbricoides TaxID=6252 RepID=A0A0M3ITH1_ASCLU